MGTSKLSSTIDSVFKSVQQQLESIFKVDTKTDKEYERAERFRDKLIYISNKYLTNNRLIIILDSIDQLSKEDYAVNWFFNDLPKKIKIIFSVLNNFENILERLKERIKKEQNILELKPFSLDKSKDMLYSYLKASKRQLTVEQRDKLGKMIENLDGPIPLQIKLIHDTVSNWKSSFDPPDEFLKCKASIEIIKYLFNRIEKVVFGDEFEILFKHCLFYLTLFEYRGISENELEDILSLDDTVLTSIFTKHHPPVRRFPMGLWYRIKYELKDYITHKMTDDIPVIAW
jgi:hypothetical protein